MRVPALEWFRDEDGWAMPEGRRGEFVGIGIMVPIFAFAVTLETALPNPVEHPVAVTLGTVVGFCYAAYWRQRVLALVPECARSFAISFLFSGGISLTILEVVHLTAPTVLFVLAASLTVFAIYGARLCSPMHDGIRPPRRGVEPPPSVDAESPVETESKTDR